MVFGMGKFFKDVEDEETRKIAAIHEILDKELDLEEEGRRLYVANVLWRAEKYAIGFLKGYRVEKYEDFTTNPAWIFIKVYWTKDDIKKSIEDVSKEIKELSCQNVLDNETEIDFEDYSEKELKNAKEVNFQE